MNTPGARVEPSESQPTRGAVTKADGGLWGVADVTKLKERARNLEDALHACHEEGAETRAEVRARSE